MYNIPCFDAPVEEVITEHTLSYYNTILNKYFIHSIYDAWINPDNNNVYILYLGKNSSEKVTHICMFKNGTEVANTTFNSNLSEDQLSNSGYSGFVGRVGNKLYIAIQYRQGDYATYVLFYKFDMNNDSLTKLYEHHYTGSESFSQTLAMHSIYFSKSNVIICFHSFGFFEINCTTDTVSTTITCLNGVFTGKPYSPDILCTDDPAHKTVVLIDYRTNSYIIDVENETYEQISNEQSSSNTVIGYKANSIIRGKTYTSIGESSGFGIITENQYKYLLPYNIYTHSQHNIINVGKLSIGFDSTNYGSFSIGSKDNAWMTRVIFTVSDKYRNVHIHPNLQMHHNTKYMINDGSAWYEFKEPQHVILPDTRFGNTCEWYKAK